MGVQKSEGEWVVKEWSEGEWVYKELSEGEMKHASTYLII